MGWDKGGRYYTRSRRENGRVVREYIGGGKIGELCAQFDVIERKEREMARQLIRAERERIESLDAALNELNEMADFLAQAALIAAGYRQHHRGEWRKCRGRTE